MTVETKKINELLEISDIDFGTHHVTLSYDSKEWGLTANYTKLGDSFTDYELYKEEVKVNLTPDQLDLICNFLKKKMDDELEGEEYHKRRSMDDPYEDNGVTPYMFI